MITSSLTLKQHTQPGSQRGAPRKEGGGGVWAGLSSKPIPILTLRRLRGEKMGLCATSGPHLAGMPPIPQRKDSVRGQLPGSPAGRPGGGGGPETAARGPTAEAALRGGAGGPGLCNIPRGFPPRIPCRLPVRRSGSGTHSHGPLPALLQRGPGSSGGSGGLGSWWAFRERRGGGTGYPRPGGRILFRRRRRPPGGKVQAAALCAPGEPLVRRVKRREPGRRRTRGS